MNSISGFNSSSGSFSINNINGTNLNKLAASADTAKTAYSNGVLHVASVGGTSYPEIQGFYEEQLVTDYPFRITAFVTQSSEPDYFQCTPGTLNSLCPGYDGDIGTSLTELPRPEIPLNFDTTSDGGVSYIYLWAGPNETNTYTFPDNNFYGNGYPDVASYSSIQTDDDDGCYVLLAKLTRIVDDNNQASVQIDQFVQSSLWGERRKFSEPDTATYYIWRA